MTQTPQEELKAVKARARKAAAKARADIAKAKQQTMVMARDADRARDEARQVRSEAEQYKENFFKALRLFEEELKISSQLRAENERLRRQLEGSPRPTNKWITSKIWEVCPN